MIKLRALAKNTFLVQTRRAEEKVFEYGLKGNLGDFYRSVIRERREFSYPPFNIFIKITIEGKKEKIAEDMSVIQTFLEPNILDIFPAYTTTVKGASAIHGLLRVESRVWPQTELMSKLRSLPPHIKVEINPEQML